MDAMCAAVDITRVTQQNSRNRKRQREEVDEEEEKIEVILEREAKRRAREEARKGARMVVEGLVGTDDKGVCYVQQKYVFTYNTANTEQTLEVNNTLDNAKVEWNTSRGCSAFSFFAEARGNNGDLLPTVMGGLTLMYKHKGPVIEDR
eukprot:2520806-Rhodomonas_salina.1